MKTDEGQAEVEMGLKMCLVHVSKEKKRLQSLEAKPKVMKVQSTCTHECIFRPILFLFNPFLAWSNPDGGFWSCGCDRSSDLPHNLTQRLFPTYFPSLTSTSLSKCLCVFFPTLLTPRVAGCPSLGTNGTEIQFLLKLPFCFSKKVHYRSPLPA